MRETAEAISTTAANLRRLDGTRLVSEAFKMSFDRITEVATKLDATHSRVVGAARALDTYWPELDRAQRDSLSALREAEVQGAALRKHQEEVSSIANAYNSSNDPNYRDGLVPDYNRAAKAARDADDALGAARRTIEAAIRAREAAAKAAIHDLDDAERESPVHDSFFDKVVDWYQKNIEPALKAVAKAIAEFAEKYGTIIEIIGLVVTIVATIAFGPVGYFVAQAAFAAVSVAFSSAKILNAQFEYDDGTITREEYEAIRSKEGKELLTSGVSLVASVVGAGVAAKVGKVWTSAEKVKKSLSLAKGFVKDKVMDALNGDEVAEAREKGEERLHQERIQEEQRMRSLILEDRQQASPNSYVRFVTTPCAA